MQAWMISSILSSMTGVAHSSIDQEKESANDLAELLIAVKAKNRDAFGAFYDMTVQRVFSLAMRITQQHTMAEEVVSDVYFQVWRQADTYSPERGSVIAWLCVLCRSRSLDALRRDSTAIRQAEVGIETVPEQDDSQGPPELLQSVEQRSAIHTALSKLTEQQRQLVALAYFRGYTHAELAMITGMPLGTVKTNIHRTMIKLKELMSDTTSMDSKSDK